jgi:hypothetical protein
VSVSGSSLKILKGTGHVKTSCSFSLILQNEEHEEETWTRDFPCLKCNAEWTLRQFVVSPGTALPALEKLPGFFDEVMGRLGALETLIKTGANVNAGALRCLQPADPEPRTGLLSVVQSWAPYQYG